MKRLCRECGAAVPAGRPACPLCGKPAPPEEPAPPAQAAPGNETRRKRACGECGGAVPSGHTACPHCGKVAPPDEAAPAAEVARETAALARETLAETARRRKAGAARAVAEVLLLLLAVPVLLPGFAVLLLMARRWGRVPLSLVVVEGVVITGLSYLGFEAGHGPLGGLVFPLMLASTLACAAVFVMRAARGVAEGGILLGWSGLVVALLMAGGALFYGGAGLVVHRLRAPLFLKVLSDVPRELAPAEAVARRELLVHALLRDARLDASASGWRMEGAGIDVFHGREDAEAVELPADALFREAAQRVGTRVRLASVSKDPAPRWIGRDWRTYLSDRSRIGSGRWWHDAGGQVLARVYLVGADVEAGEKGAGPGTLDADAAEGILAEVPPELLESTNGLDVRGRQPGDARALAIVQPGPPRRWCAPVEGTGGALWVQAEDEEAPSDGPLQGVLEWPEEAAARSLARLARTLPGADPSVRPRVLILGSAAAYRNARGMTAEAAEDVPLHHWGALALGAALTGLAALLALKEAA